MYCIICFVFTTTTLLSQQCTAIVKRQVLVTQTFTLFNCQKYRLMIKCCFAHVFQKVAEKNPTLLTSVFSSPPQSGLSYVPPPPSVCVFVPTAVQLMNHEQL